MKRIFSKLLAVLAVAVVFLNLSVTAFASESVVTWQGKEKGFAFEPGSNYTDTDLFESFKGAMPGDTLTEIITIKNTATDSDYIQFYFRAIPHNTSDDLTLSFLSQLTMRIYLGDTLLCESPADQTDTAMNEAAPISLRSGEEITIKAELEIPIGLDNKYANCAVEVDWEFIAEQFGDPVDLTVKKVWSDNGKNRPTSVTVALYDGETKVDTVTLNSTNNWTNTWKSLDGMGDWSVKEVNIPTGYKATYKTKDGVTTITNTRSLIQTGQLNWPIAVLAGAGIVCIVIGLYLNHKDRKRERH